jgi:hypothetical protein
MKVAALMFMVMVMALLAGCDRGGGGGSAPSGDSSDPLDIIRRANAALLNVRDPDTARAAKPTIQHLTGEMRDVAASMKKAGKGPPANDNDRTAAAARQVTDTALQIKAIPPLNDALGADLDAFMKAMTGT